MQTSNKYCVTHEYPMMVDGHEVIVKRYDNPVMESLIADHSELSFHKRERLNGRKWRGYGPAKRV